VTAPDLSHPDVVEAADASPVISPAFSPARMMEVELTEPLPTVKYDGQHQRLWVLGRVHTEPVGVSVLHLNPAGLTPDELATLLWLDFREPVTERFAASGFSAPGQLTGAGLPGSLASSWPFLQQRQAVLAAAPFISVVICTRDRPDELGNCLYGLARQEYPRFEVVIVDNAPTSDTVRTVVDAHQGGAPLRYVPEPRGGLSWARNAGIAAAIGDIIAFLDDDEEPDSHWLAALASGFARGDDIGCVSGIVVPARLDTEAQELFEKIGGHRNGRGFSPVIFSRHDAQSPLYPLPPFGVGANMAFRRKALASIGGFDVALGAGTPAQAGEDTLALTLVLLAGYRIAYEPAALMRHHHRRDLDSLGRQLRGYSIGLTAFYAALLRHRPSVLPALLWLVPTAVGYLRNTKATRAPVPQDPPVVLRWRRWWMFMGPLAYVRSVRRQARVVPWEARRV
jgi:O-antigen biosynthesis protein